jgi:predicted metalloprotease with PDZ domain
MKCLLFLLPVLIIFNLSAQQPGKSTQPVINYILTINDSDLSSYKIEMHISNAPDIFSVAMVKHFEYDDRYWRFVKDIKVLVKNGNGTVEREDSALWKINATANELTISYRIEPPVKNGWNGSWQPFLALDGALVGGPQSFMYIVGYTKNPSHIILNIPSGWSIATGLQPAKDIHAFYASSVYELTDEPILVGRLKTWQFSIDHVPHHIAYYTLPEAKPFDTLLLVDYIQEIVKQAHSLFGSLPYSGYTFQLVDGSYGGLEHSNSVTLGASSAELSESFTDFLSEMAHEYFHSWNLVRIRPAEYGDVTYKDNPLAKELWWSEGMTMFYADLLLRRAGLPVAEANRINHFEQLMSSYYSNAGNSKISPEKVSLAANGAPDMLGDYTASTHLQGELLGNMLDLIIRNATNNKYSIDDVMRSMMKQFGKGRGFTNNDIEQAINKTCGCNVHDFFQQYIYGSNAIDFNKYLRLAGMSSNITWIDATNDEGKLSTDLRVYAWYNAQHTLLLGITDPESIWGKAGLHTDDEIISLNNIPAITQKDFFTIIGKTNIGDTVSIEVKRSSGIYKTNVVISGYKKAVVKIEELTTATLQQQKLRWHWLAGD